MNINNREWRKKIKNVQKKKEEKCLTIIQHFKVKSVR